MPKGVRRSPAVDFVTGGTYQRNVVNETGITFTAGTEIEGTSLASVIVADVADQDSLFSWVRGKLYIYHNSLPIIFEWMIIKCLGTDALQDLNDNAVVEKLHKESRIMARDVSYGGTPTYVPPKNIKFEFYNVKLDTGEELRLVIRPILGGAGATGVICGLLEWREVGA
jgi:hypothetical protein